MVKAGELVDGRGRIRDVFVFNSGVRIRPCWNGKFSRHIFTTGHGFLGYRYDMDTFELQVIFIAWQCLEFAVNALRGSS